MQICSQYLIHHARKLFKDNFLQELLCLHKIIDQVRPPSLPLSIPKMDNEAKQKSVSFNKKEIEIIEVEWEKTFFPENDRVVRKHYQVRGLILTLKKVDLCIMCDLMIEQRQNKNNSIQSEIISILKLLLFSPDLIGGEKARQFQS